MKKKHILISLVIASLMWGGGVGIASAEGTTTPPADIAALQAQIQTLLAQVTALQASVSAQHGEIVTLQNELKLTKRLKVGDKGDEVKLLQEMLATDPEIYPEGKITGLFGPMTAKALRRFQEKNDLEGVGSVGPRTLEVLNRFLREGGAGKSGKIPQGLLRQVGNTVLLPLVGQNNSGLKGWARIRDNAGGKAVVTIELSKDGSRLDDASSTRPVHIHVGSCLALGDVKFPLTNITGGKSETILGTSTREVLNMLPLALNVHRSADELSINVACGDIKIPAIMKKMEFGEDNKKNEKKEEKPEKMPDMMMSTSAPMTMTGSTTSGVLDGGVRTFEIQSTNFKYAYPEMRAKQGERVRVVLSVVGGFHDWVIDEFSAHTAQVGAGATTTVEFIANKVGTFEYYCSVGRHRQMGMVGKLIVE